MSKKQTAVEWAFEQLEAYSSVRHPKAFCPVYLIDIPINQMQHIINEAIHLEREQIIEAKISDPNNLNLLLDAINYYNENYDRATDTDQDNS